MGLWYGWVKGNELWSAVVVGWCVGRGCWWSDGGALSLCCSVTVAALGAVPVPGAVAMVLAGGVAWEITEVTLSLNGEPGWMVG